MAEIIDKQTWFNAQKCRTKMITYNKLSTKLLIISVGTLNFVRLDHPDKMYAGKIVFFLIEISFDTHGVHLVAVTLVDSWNCIFLYRNSCLNRLERWSKPNYLPSNLILERYYCRMITWFKSNTVRWLVKS